MTFTIEFSADSERDFELIFDHLFDSYLAFGDSQAEALERAARRIFGIRAGADRLTEFPNRGTARDDVLPGVRYLAAGPAIYWFDVDEMARKVRILAIFLGGQDHVRHMLLRLLRDGGQGEVRTARVGSRLAGRVPQCGIRGGRGVLPFIESRDRVVVTTVGAAGGGDVGGRGHARIDYYVSW